MKLKTYLSGTLTAALAAVSCLSVLALGDASAADTLQFQMVSSAGVKACLPNARGTVTIRSLGPVENMHVEVRGLPKNTEFDFFVIQVPNFPFGLSWYQGDLETDRYGRGAADFVGRFNEETFIVAPGADLAPVVHNSPIADANTNPATAPVHTYHLGMWFNSPADAGKAGCSAGVTPFNGEHNAGVQVLNTSQFPKLRGPLRRLSS